ncbi:MAG: SAM-dependent methyltransferase [Deltaproteobacteria bacterium]|nr:SAM-dependent methyltransferase [Deltaproteobacteria bacterium]
MSDDDNSEVAREVKGVIGAKGRITFEEFMDLALYSPGGGYYSSKENIWGGEGDYLTSADISPVFGRVLAKQISEIWGILGSTTPFHLVEVGAGRGNLSAAILDAVQEQHCDLAEVLSLVLVDSHPSLAVEGWERVERYDRIEDIPGEVTGVVLSNELIDAFPVHIVAQGDELMEFYVAIDNGSFVEVLDTPSTPRLQEYLTRAGVTLQGGQRIEVNLRAIDWVERVGRLLKRGFIVTIDYGYPAREYFLPRRGGHLLCHYRHSVNEEPYMRVGRQDITSHVDFSSLASCGRQAGLEVVGFTTQLNYLLGMGVLEELEEVTVFDEKGVESIARNQGIKRLIMPGGMGDIFKVMIQSKGVDTPKLAGFSFKDLKEVL